MIPKKIASTLEKIFYNISFIRSNQIINRLCVTGPLVYTDEKGKTTLYGVNSYGARPPGDQKKTVYGRVAAPKILKWIRSVKGIEEIG